MRVRQLTGRLAGQIVEMNHAVGQACLAAGTAALPDDVVRVRGLTVPGDEQSGESEVHVLPPDTGDQTDLDENVAIPEDWADLHHMTLRKLAAEISGNPVESKPEAVAIIEAHISAESGIQ